ncbi:MAG: DJ-1/PfpI family protein [Lachnospiraceae bacterium]|nr:DJ-1/PfpI family protein [Lachnospiraceae bacterium]
MSYTAIFLGEGFEEVEALTPADLLRRAGITCDLVSISDSAEVKGSHGITVKADKLFSQVDFDSLDMIILPGGMPGTENLRNHPGLSSKIDEFVASGKPVSAICAAPTILGQKGVLKGIQASCYPGLENKLTEARVSYDNVSSDGIFITGRGVGTAIDFSLEIVKKFCGDDAAKKLAEAIVYSG